MFMGTYAGDRTWAARFMPVLRAIIRPLLLVPSDIEQDRREATDLIMVRARNMRLGARSRRGLVAKWLCYLLSASYARTARLPR